MGAGGSGTRGALFLISQVEYGVPFVAHVLRLQARLKDPQKKTSVLPMLDREQLNFTRLVASEGLKSKKASCDNLNRRAVCVRRLFYSSNQI